MPYTSFLPEFSVLAAAFLILLRVIVAPKRISADFPILFLGLLVSTGFALFPVMNPFEAVSWDTMLSADKFSGLFRLFIAVAALLAVSYSKDYFKDKGILGPEIPFLFLGATFGLMLMASATNFLMLIVALETASLAMYVLAAAARKERISIEAGIKFFLNSAFATAVMIWGISILFGLAGSLDYADIKSNFLRFQNVEIKPFPMLGILALVVGLGFKITLFPFHLWAPDVYQGSPTPFTLFLATASKTAGIAALLRIFDGPLHYLFGDLQGLIWILAAFTMVAASTTALWQVDAKRLLAYSSISHAGFMVMGIAAKGSLPSGEAMTSTVFYIAPYVLATAGAFTVLCYLERKRGETSLKVFNGLWKTDPMMTFTMVIFLASLAGLPPTLGFLGKYLLFVDAYEAGLRWLLGAAILSTVVSLFFYFSIIRCMLLNEPPEKTEEKPFCLNDIGPIVLLVACAAFAISGFGAVALVLAGLFVVWGVIVLRGPRFFLLGISAVLLGAIFFWDPIYALCVEAIKGL
ncbi:MAG: NADH-quinone oxidoreductase subunit N [Planctomycetota bacterium]